MMRMIGTSLLALLSLFALKVERAGALPITDRAGIHAGLRSAGALPEENATASGFPRNVQLRKQYVPVMKKEGGIMAYKTSYFGTIHVGYPVAQDFTVVFDTGSGHLIIPSSGCVSETCMKHRRYNRSLSETAIDIESDGMPLQMDASERDQISIAFGTGEVVGEFVHEKVCLGENNQGCLNLRTVLATEMTEDPFSLFAFDGVLGLGLAALTLDPGFSLFSELMRQKQGLLPMFAVYLARTDQGESIVSFGGYNTSLATSEIVWAPVARPDLGYWQVQVKGVRIGDTPIGDCEDGSCYAILDTGTSLLGIPRQMTRSMHRLLARAVPSDHSASNVDNIDCRTIPGQKMHFDIGDITVTLEEEDYSRPIPFNMTVKDDTGNDAWRLFCRSLLLPVDMEEPLGAKVFLWGEPMLRRYYTVYDVAKKQIGFSVANEEIGSGREGLPPVDPPPLGSTLSGSPLVRPLVSSEPTSTSEAVDV
jgi:hypothetical protein